MAVGYNPRIATEELVLALDAGNPKSYPRIEDNFMIVVAGLLDDEDVKSSVTAPSGYTLAQVEDTTSGTCTIMTAYKTQTSAGTENPGAFGGSGTAGYKAHTIALQKNSNATTITYVGGINQESTSSDLTLTGLQSGDLVLFYSAHDFSAVNTPSSGWTGIPGLPNQPDNDGFPNSAAFYKFSTGSSVTAGNIASSGVELMIAFRGVDSSNPFNVNSIETNGTGMPDPAAITTTSTTIWTDISGQGNNATLVNTPTFSFADGGSVVFDGTNDYANFGSNILTSSTTEISCFFWIYPVSDGIILSVLGQSSINTGYHHSSIEIGSSGELRMSLWHGNLNNKVTSSLSFNSWNNVGFTYSGTTLTGYLNGSSVGTATFTWSKTSNFYFGIMAEDSTNMGTSAYGHGNVSNFFIYKKALTASEVLKNYNALKVRFGL